MTKVISAVLFTALLLFSCEQPYDFGEYSGTDLISSQGFESGDWEPDQPAPYLNFEEVTESDHGYPGAPEGDTEEPVYRVEVLNLFPNGDFEDEATAIGDRPAQWTETGGVSTAEVIDNADAINGRSLDVEVPVGAQLSTNLGNQLGNGGNAFEADTDYRFLFDLKFKSEDGLKAELNDGTDTAKTNSFWSISRPEDGDADAVVAFPREANFDGNNVIVPNAEYDSFSFGGYSTEASDRVDAIVDDFRIVKNKPLFLRLPVPRNASGRPELLDGGTYTFRILVRDDPTVHDYPAGGANRFPANALTVRLANPDTQTETAPLTQARSSSWSNSWTELSFEFDGFQLPDNDPALEVLLRPGGVDGALDAGSLLIADPQLYWSEK